MDSYFQTSKYALVYNACWESKSKKITYFKVKEMDMSEEKSENRLGTTLYVMASVLLLVHIYQMGANIGNRFFHNSHFAYEN